MFCRDEFIAIVLLPFLKVAVRRFSRERKKLKETVKWNRKGFASNLHMNTWDGTLCSWWSTRNWIYLWWSSWILLGIAEWLTLLNWDSVITKFQVSFPCFLKVKTKSPSREKKQIVAIWCNICVQNGNKNEIEKAHLTIFPNRKMFTITRYYLKSQTRYSL